MLSWPNPTAEKVFILTKSHHPSSTESGGTNRARRLSTHTSTAGDLPDGCAVSQSHSNERCAQHGMLNNPFLSTSEPSNFMALYKFILLIRLLT